MTTDKLVERIIGCATTVSNALGCGFLEEVYRGALAHELRKAGLTVKEQAPVSVLYDDVLVGEYAADLVVEDAVALEIEAAKAIEAVHEAQLRNFLKAADLGVGLLLNFGTPRLGIRRMVK